MSQREGLASYLSSETSQLSQDREPPKRVLAIGAHPDDIEFGAGGTLAKWAASGTSIAVMVLTDGRRGTWNKDLALHELAEIRHQEAQAATQDLGRNASLVWLGYEDGTLSNHPEVICDIVREIRTVKPDVIISHDPWKRYRIHPDHRQAGFFTTDAIAMARDLTFYPELGPSPHRPDDLLLFEADEVDHVETISSYLGAKAQSLSRHRSQFPSSFGIAEDTANPIDVILERLCASGGAVEGFKRMTDL